MGSGDVYKRQSQDYYRTDSLRQGQELEVYVETQDGWLGVRPPENSFCWVPASAIQSEKRGTVGTVIEDRTVAWIGTHLGRAKRYRWQVQLAEGESVTVIGRSEREGPDGPQMWYRIVPPSGEFRWVHRSQVAMSAEELIAAIERNRQSKPAERRERTNRVADAEEKQPESQSRLADLGKSILSLAGSDEEPRVPHKAVVVRAAGSESNLRDVAVSDVSATGDRSSSRRNAATLQRIADANTVPLQAAPLPQNDRSPQPIESYPIAQRAAQPPVAIQSPIPAGAPAVGSGLDERWQNNTVRPSVNESLAGSTNGVHGQRPVQSQRRTQHAASQYQGLSLIHI